MKVQFLPAQKLLNLDNYQVQTQFLNFFGIQKLFRLVYFFDKHYSKKVFRIDMLISFFNQAVNARKNFFFSLINKFLFHVLLVLRQIGCLVDFFFVPRSLFLNRLLFTTKFFLDTTLVLAYLNKTLEVIGTFQKIKILSKPSRQVYVSYRNLKKIYISAQVEQRVFVLTTNQGILTHTEALKKKIGGTLLFLS